DMTMDESFGMGDEISFEYSIVSDQTQTIHYMPHIKCPQAPIPLLEIKTLKLKKNEPLIDTYNYLTIGDNLEPQACTAGVYIMSSGMEGEEEPEVIQKKEAQFIIDIPPGFEFYPITCKDKACNNKAKVFILNETMHLNYESEVPGVSVTGLLTRPDSSTRELTLPTTEPASQIGTYKLMAEASKEGYKTMKVDSLFGVIEKKVEISSAATCVVNGVCDEGETLHNCPQDCALTDSDNDGVANYKDKCPDTPPGQSVDDEGCSCPQRIARAKSLVEALNASIQALPDSAFDKNAKHRKKTLSNKLNAILNQINSGAYQGVIDKLNDDIESKMDGCVGGDSGDDWITDCSAQKELTKAINDIIAELDKIIKAC
ncbi:MAG: hypothetical protein JSU92_03770, partial [Deltaproteobacteria bacterium]